MNIGICAFLLIVHGLQQKDGEPPMPQQCAGRYGPRHTVSKRSTHGTNLGETLGQFLGIQLYLDPVRRAFDVILRQLDTQMCRSTMQPKEASHKEADEPIT